MSTKTIAQIFSLCFLLVATGCKPKLIPNTSVRDTKENRAVTKFMDDYRNAIVSRSIPEIMALVSPDYLETNATNEPGDDYNYVQLQEKLEKTFSHVKEINLRMHIQNILHKESKYDVFYFFNQHSLVDLPSGEQWMAVNDVNRLVLKPKGDTIEGGFEILSGL